MNVLFHNIVAFRYAGTLLNDDVFHKRSVVENRPLQVDMGTNFSRGFATIFYQFEIECLSSIDFYRH